MMDSLIIFAPSGVETRLAQVQRARRRLTAWGWSVDIDPGVRRRHMRFAGSDDERLQALHRVAAEGPGVALACRGGYGLSRLLDRIDWQLLARSVDQGTRWVGYSDLTALQLGLLAHTRRPSWHGPMATDDFGRSDFADQDEAECNEITQECFRQAMVGELEAVGFRTDSGHDGLECRGLLWGGNLTMVCSLLGTPHWPDIRDGILFLEDVGEHPYRVERLLLQLQQAGVLDRQKAVVLGSFSDWKPSPLDRGYGLRSMLARLREVLNVPVLTGLPFGHQPLKLTLPVGLRTDLAVSGRQALLHWGDGS